MRALGFPQRPLDAWPRRWGRRLAQWLGRRPARSQRVYEVRLGGCRAKRIVLPDSYAAATIAANLERFAPSGIYPELLFAKENELWVEFVEGRRVERADAALAEAFARLLAVLNRAGPHREPIDHTRFARAVFVDLRFLRDVGVLDPDEWRRLDALAERLRPREVWLGYDCTDAILKNFLRCDGGRLRGVDVESLGAEQLLGTGAAKALLRWAEPHRDALLGELRKQEVPDYLVDLPFVELGFRAFWLKSSFLEGKRRFVDPALLRGFPA